MIRPRDRVLEPSAGTGILAVMAHCSLRETASQRLYLNELAPTRAGLLEGLFPGVSVDRRNAETIADYLPGLVPSVVLMNPPFSVSPGVERRRHDADLRHIRSAFSMLPPGGRLVAITSHSCVPGSPAWQGAFRYLDPPAQAVFSMAIEGRAYARHGTSFDTRLTVLDRLTREACDDAVTGLLLRSRRIAAPDAAALLASRSGPRAATPTAGPETRRAPAGRRVLPPIAAQRRTQRKRGRPGRSPRPPARASHRLGSRRPNSSTTRPPRPASRSEGAFNG